jgi:hypothetical protein
MSSEVKVSNLDFMGIFLSVLCAIHCTMTPLVLLFLPSLKGFFDSEYFHLAIFLFIVPIAVFSFLRCHKLHGDKNVLYLGGAALLCMFLGMLLEDYSHKLETYLTICGSVLIVFAHIKNIRHCHCLRQKPKCHH